MNLTPDRADAFGRELDTIRDRVTAELGASDVRYIRRIIKAQRCFELGGRAVLFFGRYPAAWLAGTSMLALSRVLDNLEIGHNVMHGQYDWTGDPALSSRQFEWDNACPSAQWRHSHNYLHHTHTNIVGKDRDVGFGILRMSEDQPWRPYFLGNPIYAALLMLFFDYALALHELEIERIQAREISLSDKRDVLVESWHKISRKLLRDYVAYPLLAGRSAPYVIAGNLAANIIPNVWAAIIIFCGHFPDGTRAFTVDETKDETRGMWYFRQVLGSANFTGGPVLRLLSGNLTNHIEHHLYPYLPARRYAEIAPEVQRICERYGVPYNVAPVYRQFGTFVRRVAKLALPRRGDAAPRSVTSGAALPS